MSTTRDENIIQSTLCLYNRRERETFFHMSATRAARFLSKCLSTTWAYTDCCTKLLPWLQKVQMRLQITVCLSACNKRLPFLSFLNHWFYIIYCVRVCEPIIQMVTRDNQFHLGLKKTNYFHTLIMGKT